MTKEEFIKKAKEFGYADEDINEFVELTESARKDGVNLKYDDIVLVEQPVY